MLSALNPLSLNRRCTHSGAGSPCYTGGISNTEGIHVLHSLLSSYQFQATLPVAEQLISMSLVIGLNEHALCSFQASTRQVFCEGADYSGLDRVEVCILVESTPHPSFTLYFVSISAYIFCDIVRPAYVITNDTPHLLHRCMPAAHDISLSPVTTFSFIIISNSSCFLFHTVHPVHEQRKQSCRARSAGQDRDSTPPRTTAEHVSNSSEGG
ncbi:hypothetical protein BLNAU_14966 [Blattamonas nauphoetae]|uniref:Uncharacterized protein n=1 Tax=Blattamonas nauphoetae TaxID=2049346 RepID=A0ABQ9XEC9_9EUKA|nr:hypothetical protein BLNAU_14966 [Blattamonas nauphoetae]